MNGTTEKMERQMRAQKVMLVDDNAQSRYVLAQQLRSEGYEVHSAAGHESWLALFNGCLSNSATWVSFVAAMEPDVLLLDLEMHGDDALSTLGELKRHPLTSNIPVITLTSDDGCFAQRAAQTLGAESSIVRPLSRRGLSPLLEPILRDSRRHCRLPHRSGSPALAS